MRMFLLIAAAFYNSCTVAQSAFSFNYNFFADHYVSRTNHETPDGGFIQSGRSGTNLVLVKINECYQEDWNKTYNLGTGGFESSVHPYGNNGYVVAAQTTSPSSTIVMRADNNGDIIWAKRFNASATLLMNAIDVDANNNIFISGSYYRATFDFDFFMMLLDANGNMLWNKTWGGGNGGAQVAWEQAYTGMATADGGYLVAGTHHTVNDTSFWSAQPPGDNTVVLKLDANGDLQWAKSFGGDLYERIFDVCEVPGGLIFSGTTSTNAFGGAGWDAYLLKISTDANGNFAQVDWVKNVGYSADVVSDDFYSVKYRNGKIFAGGVYNGSENFIMAFDIDGNDLGIAKQYEGFELHSIVPKPDGGVVFIDHISWSAMRLVKTDNNLQTHSSCEATSITPGVVGGVAAVGNAGSKITFGVINGGLNTTDITSAISAGSLNVQRSNICPTITNLEPSFSVSNSTICPNECVDFYNLTAGNALCYAWSFLGANTMISAAENPSGICYSQIGTYDVQLTAYDIHGSSDTIVQNFIQVAQQSFLNITGNEINCDADSLTLTASGGNNYLWSNGATTAVITVAAIDGDEYYVLSTLNTCEDSTGTTINIVGNNPIANFTITQQGTAIGFKNLSQNATSYEWTFDFNNATSTDEDPNFTYTEEGTYEICLTVTNACGSDIFCQTIDILISNIAEVALTPELFLYPNPIEHNNVLNVSISKTQTDNLQVKIIDSKGSVINQNSWKTNNVDQDVFQLNLSEMNLSKGVYQLMFRSEQLSKSIRLTVI